MPMFTSTSASLPEKSSSWLHLGTRSAQEALSNHQCYSLPPAELPMGEQALRIVGS